MKKNISNRGNSVQESDSAVNLYFVKQGETLESISWDLNLENYEYLREYHNARCSPLDLIPGDGTLRLLQKLCIPSSDEIQAINRTIRQNGESLRYLLPQGNIPFDISLVNGDYAVRQTESDDGVQKSEYAYELHFTYVKEEEGRYYVQFSMGGFKKDGEEPGQKISSLAADFVKIIYPVTLITDHSGNFVAAESHKEITEIIREIEKLKSYHTGPYAASHIDQMKQTMADSQNMYNSLKKMLAIQFIFNRFYQAHYHSKDTTFPYKDELSWLAPALPVRMEMIHQILPQTDTGFIELLQKGRSADYRTVQELYFTHQDYDEHIRPHPASVEARHKALYTLDGKDFSILKINAETELQMPGYEKKITFELEKIIGHNYH